MKRIPCLFAFVLVAAELVFSQAPVATLKQVTGTVEIKAPGKDWAPAKAGAALTKNTVISTGFKSVAIVTLGGSTLTVKPLTRLTLEEIARQEGSEQVKLYLLAGRVRADVKPPAGGKTDFSVKSPTATASVRGTGFGFDGWNLDVTEGGVRFLGPGGQEYLVGPGNFSHLDADGNPVDPRLLAEQLASLPPPAGMDAAAFQSFLQSLGLFGVKLGDIVVTVDW